MGRWAGVGQCRVAIDVILRRIMDMSKDGNPAPIWVQPFRIAAGVLGAMLVAAAVASLVWTASVPITARGAVMTAALLWFACVPRRLLGKFWIAAALLACAALAVVLVHPRGIGSREGEMAMLYGDILLGAVFVAMLVDAVLSRRREAG